MYTANAYDESCLSVGFASQSGMSMGSQECLTFTSGLMLLTLTDVDEETLCIHTARRLPSCAPYEIWDVFWLHGISHRVNKLT